MSDATRPMELFDMLAKVLLRCWLFGFLLVLLMWSVYMLTGDLLYSLHGEWIGLSKHRTRLDLLLLDGVVKAHRAPVLRVSMAGNPTGAAEGDGVRGGDG